jgi:hypothetical protein
MSPANRLLRRRLLAALPLLSLPSWAAGAPLLTVAGTGLGPPAVDGSFGFDLAALQRLPQRRIVTRTPWYNSVTEFAGPLLRDVLQAAGVPPDSTRPLRCTALNDYRIEIPQEDVRRWDVVVAHLLNGKPMSVREKGPLFVIYPFDDQPQLRTATYFSRCVWQLKRIELA